MFERPITRFFSAIEAGGRAVRLPDPGSTEESLLFREIQEKFKDQFEKAFPDKLAPKAVVIIPSLTLDQEILSKVKGVVHYEERLLCMLTLLRMPQTHVIYLSSTTIDPVIVDYYLHLLPSGYWYSIHPVRTTIDKYPLQEMHSA